jgi:hypothetical protein
MSIAKDLDRPVDKLINDPEMEEVLRDETPSEHTDPEHDADFDQEAPPLKTMDEEGKQRDTIPYDKT